MKHLLYQLFLGIALQLTGFSLLIFFCSAMIVGNQSGGGPFFLFLFGGAFLLIIAGLIRIITAKPKDQPPQPPEQ